MASIRFDGFRESMLTDYCIDDNCRYQLRDDFEAAAECRQAYREERRRRQAQIDALTYMAVGMLVAVLLLVLGR